MYSFDPEKNSILSVTSSVLRHYGIQTNHDGIEELERCLDGCRNVIVMLFDGLGMNAVEKHLNADSFFRRNLKGRISSVFPPTTVAATASVMSGKSVREHGRLGYYQYFEEVNDNVSIFGNELQNRNTVIEGEKLSDMVFPVKNFTEQVSEDNQDINTAVFSPVFGNICHDLSELCEKTSEYSHKPGRNLIYSYWDNPDRDMHIHGTGSAEASDTVKNIDSQTEKMFGSLPDSTALIIIADHGLIDTEWINLYSYPKLSSMLELRPSMERRTTSLFVKKEMEKKFEKLFNESLGDKFILMRREEFLSSELLGKGNNHPRLDNAVGNYVAIATDRWSLEIENYDNKMKACHAGLTREEAEIPLIYVRK